MIKEYEKFVKDMIFINPSKVEQMCVLGICGEGGEIADHYKKNLRGDTTRERLEELVVKEIGDVLFYLTALSNDLGVSLEEIMNMNIAKLSDRKKRNALQGDGDER